MKLLLCGNPNVGKTTLFNRLTRSSAPVGNWHGVTVDALTKRVSGEKDIVISDLPGAYSLSARTDEEKITRDAILFGDFDAVVYVAEANNLRRNLYMLTQILEAGKRAVLVVNMMDEARGTLDLEMISRRLGVPVVGASEKQKNPKSDIIRAAAQAASPVLPYFDDPSVMKTARLVWESARKKSLEPRFAALKILENDSYVSALVGADGRKCASGCSACGGCDVDLPSRLRYGYIDGLLSGAVKRDESVYRRTNKIDGVVLGKFALPIFFAVMAAVFAVTFSVGAPLSALLTAPIGMLSRCVREASAIPEFLRLLIADGVISGAGAVLAFMPQIIILFLLTALLQDSGYMSRVAFVTDGFFRRFGLSGRAAFSLILGLGCSVTAVLSTRGISDATARRRTAFIAPFCPCNARLAVFTAMTAYFGLPWFVIAVLYVLGFLCSLAVLKVMRFFKKGVQEETLLMEMPPYRLPSGKRVFKSVLKNILSFVGRVGSVVLAVSVFMWVLGNFSIGYGFSGNAETSILGTFAGFLAPVFKPLGFGNWRAVSALISGIAAKESVVSVIAAMGGAGAVFGGRTEAVSFLIFTALYVPCVATLAAIAKENGIKSAVLSAVVHTLVAYIASLAYYGSARMYVENRTLFYIISAINTVAATLLSVIVAAVKARRKRLRENRVSVQTSENV